MTFSAYCQQRFWFIFHGCKTNNMALLAFNKLLLVVGFVFLIHAAYSAAQHRTYLRITEQESTFLPFDILLQAITSLFLIIYSLLQVVGEFKEIRAAIDLQGKSWETLSNIPSFYSFNHRGKALSPTYIDPNNIGKSSLDMDE